MPMKNTVQDPILHTYIIVQLYLLHLYTTFIEMDNTYFLPLNLKEIFCKLKTLMESLILFLI